MADFRDSSHFYKLILNWCAFTKKKIKIKTKLKSKRGKFESCSVLNKDYASCYKRNVNEKIFKFDCIAIFEKCKKNHKEKSIYKIMFGCQCLPFNKISSVMESKSIAKNQQYIHNNAVSPLKHDLFNYFNIYNFVDTKKKHLG